MVSGMVMTGSDNEEKGEEKRRRRKGDADIFTPTNPLSRKMSASPFISVPFYFRWIDTHADDFDHLQ
jgi:hypothetical protein